MSLPLQRLLPRELDTQVRARHGGTCALLAQEVLEGDACWTGALPTVMARFLEPSLLLLLSLLPGSASSAAGNRCVAAAEACTADALCSQLRSEFVARCLGRAAPGDCARSRCRRALRRFFARGPPALTHRLLFCPCVGPACAERRRQTFVPACAFARPGRAPPSCLAPLERCERSRLCRPRLLAFQASCAPAPGSRDGCPEDRGPHCLHAYAGLVGTAVTPNYVDNASARVAPWCDCGASGNRREECEAFRGLFTRNSCLDSAIQAFDSTWPSILQGQLDHQDAGHSSLQASSADGTLEEYSLLSTLAALAFQTLLYLGRQTLDNTADCYTAWVMGPHLWPTAH